MLSSFRILSILEGLSLVLLIFIAMPAKYQFGIPQLVPWFGLTHGVLWSIYFVMSLAVSHHQKWSVLTWLLTLLVSIVPFAFLWQDSRLTIEGQRKLGAA